MVCWIKALDPWRTCVPCLAPCSGILQPDALFSPEGGYDMVSACRKFQNSRLFLASLLRLLFNILNRTARRGGSLQGCLILIAGMTGYGKPDSSKKRDISKYI